MSEIEHQIESALQEVRPLLAMHAGNIELVRVDESSGEVLVRFLGTCHGCALSSLTLSMGVETVLKERVPAVRSVRDVDAPSTIAV
jgi:Fe-S cluster biogenesis protein NfuA